MEQINRTTRTFILAAVGLAVAIWDISFNFGVYGTIFFEKLFLIWVGCTAVLLAILFLPEEKRPFGHWTHLALSMPSVWLLSVAIDSRLLDVDINNAIIFILATVANLISLPYAAYVLLTLTQRDAMRLSNRYIFALIGIATIMGLLGYIIGLNNDLFLSCADFAISGAAEPANCYKGGTNLTAPQQ
ncbi:MAG: hypothetical protein AAF614_02190 [Chloroflexota bacterium]